jgi:hypothetical protein
MGVSESKNAQHNTYQLSGKLKPPKTRNVSIVIRKLQGDVAETFQNFLETTTHDVGKKLPGSARDATSAASTKGSAVSRGALALLGEVLKKISCGGVLWFWFVSLWESFEIYLPLGLPPG